MTNLIKYLHLLDLVGSVYINVLTTMSELPLTEIIAVLALIVTPVLTWFLRRNKVGAEIRLIDAQVLKQWTDLRTADAEEISSLREENMELNDLIEEAQLKRRSERTKYLKIIDSLQGGREDGM